jgi:hypothetical protein
MSDFQPPEETQTSPIYSTAAGLGLTALVLVIWFAGLSVLEIVTDIILHSNSNLFLILGAIEFLYTAGFAIVTIWILNEPNPLIFTGLRPKAMSFWHWTGGLILGCTGVGVAVCVIMISGDIRLVPAVSVETGIEPDSIWQMTWISAILSFVFYAGNEEILARGVLYPMLRKYSGMIWALVLSSGVFSVLHILNPNYSIYAAIDIYLAGICLALLRETTGDLYLAWGTHFGWNIGLIVLGLPVSGFYISITGMPYRLAATGNQIITGGSFGPEGGLSGIAGSFVMALAATLLLLARKRKAALPTIV